MIITQERLVALAQESVERLAGREPILAAYLIGSVVGSEPVLGGTADIDIVVIEPSAPLVDRQVQSLSPDVHLDIVFHDRELYSKPRRLRRHPWLGPALWRQQRLYDPKHFFDWAQAGAAAQFQRAENVIARATALLDHARRLKPEIRGARWLHPYMLATMNGLNAVVSLSGLPVSGRRLVTKAREQLVPLGQSDLHDAFLGLIDAIDPADWQLSEWFQAWSSAFEAQEEYRTPDLSEPRRAYYLRGYQALAEQGQASAVIWPLVKTWVEILDNIPEGDNRSQHDEQLQPALHRLRLTEEFQSARASQLESYLDRVELTIEAWARERGV